LGANLEKQIWGLVGDSQVHRYGLASAGGLSITVSDLGATMLSCVLPDSMHGGIDVVLGCGTVEQHLNSGTYFGATVGRFGNRIRRGHFTLNGRSYGLSRNEGDNHLHGGTIGFDKRIWTVGHRDAESISFVLVSDDDDEGYPGTLIARSTYSVAGNVLRYELIASADAPTPVNLLNHSYWNLAGNGEVLDHLFQFEADYYTPCDDELMLTGEIASVASTPFDFRTARSAREGVKQIHNGGAGRVSGESGGYDHNLVLNGYDGELRHVARISDPGSGRSVAVATTEPGLHFYTGGYLGGVPDRRGGRYSAFAGFTLETQRFPDSPNMGHFPSCILAPGQVYRHITELTFGY
jgi:aldose 1-epimerase